MRVLGRQQFIDISEKNGKSILYVIRCFNDEENFYKVGVTTLSDNSRFYHSLRKTPCFSQGMKGVKLVKNKIVYNINAYKSWVKNENTKAPNQRQTYQVANFVSKTG